MSSLRDSNEWVIGDKGQRAVAKFLREQGWWVVPSYEFSGSSDDKAPMLEGPLKGLILPDLDCAKDGQRMWVEVKTKTAATMTYDPCAIPGLSFKEARQQGIEGIAEHGISERQALDYLEVARITGADVYLVVYELSTSDVLWARLEPLVASARKSVMRKGLRYEGYMLYFARSDLRLLGKL